MGEAFLLNMDALVTKDYLDAKFAEQDGRIDTRFAEMDGKHRLLTWMLAVVMASTVIPAMHQLLV